MGNPKPFKATRLREILEEKGMMEIVLANQLGLTKSAISRKINGSRSWKLSEMTAIAVLLEMPAEEIFVEMFSTPPGELESVPI